MRKIPSIFVRDFDGDPRLVLPQITTGCEWVFKGEGTPTRKRDGTACMVDAQGRLWRRYDAKGGKAPPDDFLPAQDKPDEVTGHWPGWVPVGNGPQDKWYRATPAPTEPGTYELCGPKFQANTEKLDAHVFFRHGSEIVELPPRMLEGDAETALKAAAFVFSALEMEGVVWHHPDGRMAKLKRSDLGLTWPIDERRTEHGRAKK